MLESLYQEHMLPESEYDPLFDVSLKIDTTSIPKTQKVKKSMDEETQAKIRAENELVREKREVVAEGIASKIAKFKNDFLSAPIRRAAVASAGDEIIPPVEVPYRQDEKYWVMMPAKGSILVFFSVNFKNSTDMSLARVMLLEFVDSQRKVKTAPGVTFHDKEFPQDVSKVFPGSEKEQYSNGCVSFRLTHANHFAREGLEQPLNFLINFRMFVHYHLHAIKTQLHSRMRTRVEAFERIIKMAQRDKDGPKNWKETHGGMLEEDRELKEQKKVEEVFVMKK